MATKTRIARFPPSEPERGNNPFPNMLPDSWCAALFVHGASEYHTREKKQPMECHGLFMFYSTCGYLIFNDFTERSKAGRKDAFIGPK